MIPTSVLYVVNSSLASPTGGGRTRVISEAKQAKKHNFTVRILCFFPPQHAVFKLRLLASGKVKLERESRCKVHYFPRLPLTRIPLVNWLNCWYCGLVVVMLCWCYRIKIVHGHGFGPALFALIAKKVKGSIKVVADLHGLSVEEYMYSLKGSHRDKLAELLQEREILVLHRADWIIFVSQAMRKYFEEKHRSYFKNFSVIPCATESTFEIDHGRREVLRREYGLSGKRVFCYVGSAAPYQRVERMCHLFGEILRLFPDSFFLAFSHHRDVFLSYLKDLEINPSNYKLASVDHDKILDLLQIGDIGLLLRDDSIVNRVASPTKFAEYCLSGLPIITTAFVGDFSELVKQYRLGWIIDLANLNADSSLTAFINEVQENRLEYAKRCSSFAKEHISWEVYGKALASVYTNFIGGARIEAPLTSD